MGWNPVASLSQLLTPKATEVQAATHFGCFSMVVNFQQKIPTNTPPTRPVPLDRPSGVPPGCRGLDPARTQSNAECLLGTVPRCNPALCRFVRMQRCIQMQRTPVSGLSQCSTRDSGNQESDTLWLFFNSGEFSEKTAIQASDGPHS